MKNIFTTCIIVSALLFQFSCSKDVKSEILECSFIGTFNNEEFNFLENDLGFSKGTKVTGEVDYGVSSGFGPRWASGSGVGFHFFFKEKPSANLINELKGQKLLNSSNEFPYLRISVTKDGEQYSSGLGDDIDDIFEIESITPTGKDYDFQTSEFEAGKLFFIKGRMKMVNKDVVVQGEFNLKLAEIK